MQFEDFYFSDWFLCWREVLASSGRRWDLTIAQLVLYWPVTGVDYERTGFFLTLVVFLSLSHVVLRDSCLHLFSLELVLVVYIDHHTGALSGIGFIRVWAWFNTWSKLAIGGNDFGLLLADLWAQNWSFRGFLSRSTYLIGLGNVCCWFLGEWGSFWSFYWFLAGWRWGVRLRVYAMWFSTYYLLLPDAYRLCWSLACDFFISNWCWLLAYNILFDTRLFGFFASDLFHLVFAYFLWFLAQYLCILGYPMWFMRAIGFDWRDGGWFLWLNFFFNRWLHLLFCWLMDGCCFLALDILRRNVTSFRFCVLLDKFTRFLWSSLFNCWMLADWSRFFRCFIILMDCFWLRLWWSLFHRLYRLVFI